MGGKSDGRNHFFYKMKFVSHLINYSNLKLNVISFKFKKIIIKIQKLKNSTISTIMSIYLYSKAGFHFLFSELCNFLFHLFKSKILFI